MIFEVLQDGTKNGNVWLRAVLPDGRLILGEVTREALSDSCEPPQEQLSAADLIMLATSNQPILSEALAAKVAAGEAVTPKPGDWPRVTLRNGELRAAGITLSPSVLNSRFGWADRVGRF